jgi:uncharacterized integral membrane protein
MQTEAGSTIAQSTEGTQSALPYVVIGVIILVIIIAVFIVWKRKGNKG